MCIIVSWDHWVTETPRTYVAPFGSATISEKNSFDILGDEPYELPTEPFGGAEQLDWAPDGRHIAYSCRKHMGKEYAFSTNTGIYVYDLLSGETLACSLWLDASGAPVYAEIAKNDKIIAAAEFTNFIFGDILSPDAVQ